jgi:hypothetical protein
MRLRCVAAHRDRRGDGHAGAAAFPDPAIMDVQINIQINNN